MNRTEAAEQFQRMQANWNFLNFADQTTFDIWFVALSKYDVGEVRVGINRAMQELKTTPTVADIVEYINAIWSDRKRQREADARRMADAMRPGAIQCQECHDLGYQLVVYPGDYEYYRPCPKRCNAAVEAYGKHVWDKMDSGKYGIGARDICVMLGIGDKEKALAEWKKYVEVEAEKQIVDVGNPPVKKIVYIPAARKPSGMVIRAWVKK